MTKSPGASAEAPGPPRRRAAVPVVLAGAIIVPFILIRSVLRARGGRRKMHRRGMRGKSAARNVEHSGHAYGRAVTDGVPAPSQR